MNDQLESALRALPAPPSALLASAKAFYRRQRLLEALIGRLAEDPALRAKARARPKAVLRDAGLDPAPELIALLLAEDGVTRRTEPAQRLAARRLWG